jgi:hypothetical protein
MAVRSARFPRAAVPGEPGGRDRDDQDERGDRGHELVEAPPELRSAVISESAERRPKATRIARSMAIGTVTSRKRGEQVQEHAPTSWRGDAAVHHQLDELQQPGEQENEREDPEPRTNGTRISPKTYRWRTFRTSRRGFS